MCKRLRVLKQNLPEVKTKVRYSIVSLLNQRMMELYEKEERLQSSLSGATTSADSEAARDPIIIRILEELQALRLQQYMILERLPTITDVFITPSELKQSKCSETFFDLMDAMELGRTKMLDRVVDFDQQLENSQSLQFTFCWKSGQVERDSYHHLQTHLDAFGIKTVIVSDGEGLPDGLLYDVELWALRPNIQVRSGGLQKVGQSMISKFILRGRTDLVRVKDDKDHLGSSNNRYFIEIKCAEGCEEEESLREAVLQLVGGNASNPYHSPPVVITNLSTSHFVLFFERDGDPNVSRKCNLRVLKMDTFGTAIAFVENHTSEMRSVTQYFGQLSSLARLPEKEVASVDNDTDDDMVDHFDNVYLEEVG